jgi:hypothetical protein
MPYFVRHWFDGPALYAAMDAQRPARGISWQQVARETGVVASTIVATKRAGLIETDGMLAMVRWLGCTPEKFIRGSESLSVTQTPSETAKFLAGQRFNAKTLYQALDARRRSRKITWLEVAQEIGGWQPHTGWPQIGCRTRRFCVCGFRSHCNPGQSGIATAHEFQVVFFLDKLLFPAYSSLWVLTRLLTVAPASRWRFAFWRPPIDLLSPA